MNSISALLYLKSALFKNGLLRLARKSRVEFLTLLVFFTATAAGLYFFFSWSLGFFQSQEPFGAILIDETLYLFTLALMSMLFVSSAVSAYASLFRSGEVSFLAVQPLAWNRIFFLKLGEGVWLSSWSLLWVALPFVIAYGQTKHSAPWFPLLCFSYFIPFILLTGTLGTLTTVLLMGLLPNRKRRRIALGLGLFTGIALLAHIQPEIIKEQGSLAGVLSGYLPHVAMAKNGFLPSSWVARGIIESAQIRTLSILPVSDSFFYFQLLLSNALFLLLPAAWIGSRLYPAIFFRVQDHGEGEKLRRASGSSAFEKFIDSLPGVSRPALALFEKDVKTFFRDPSEWSQMLIFFGLLVLYFANLRNLEFHILKDMWKNLVFVLNTLGTYIVLSSFSMRFIFPMLSLEGNRFWLISLSPLRFSEILMEKLVLGVLLSGALTLPLVVLSGVMLEMPGERIIFTAGLGFFVCIALTGLSVGFGALFPNFKSTNPSEIISGAGGSLLLTAHLSYLALVGFFLAFSQEPRMLTFVLAALGSLITGFVPMQAGIHQLKRRDF